MIVVCTLKAAKLGETFGTDASSLVDVVLAAAANAKEPTRVFNIECRQKGGDGTYPLMADVDAGFVMAREGATLAELRTVVTAAGRPQPPGEELSPEPGLPRQL